LIFTKMLASTVQFSNNQRPRPHQTRLPHPHPHTRAQTKRFVVQGPARTRHPTNRWPVTWGPNSVLDKPPRPHPWCSTTTRTNPEGTVRAGRYWHQQDQESSFVNVPPMSNHPPHGRRWRGTWTTHPPANTSGRGLVAP